MSAVNIKLLKTVHDCLFNLSLIHALAESRRRTSVRPLDINIAILEKQIMTTSNKTHDKWRSDLATISYWRQECRRTHVNSTF